MAQLPKEVPGKIQRWAKAVLKDELGGEWLIWEAVRGHSAPELWEVMELGRTVGKSRWMAEVHCTACGEDILTEGGRSSFWLGTGPDGNTYPVQSGKTLRDFMDDGDMVYTEIGEGDGALCPMCGCEGKAIRKHSVQGGRTKRIMAVSVEVIDGYAVVMYWLLSREIWEYGVIPGGEAIAAFAIDEDGGLAAFRRGKGRGIYGGIKIPNDWESCRCSWDCIDTVYHDWGSIGNRKKGAVLYPECQALAGTTGEKTGLEAMVRAGATERLTEYLRMRQKKPGIENLANQGYGYTVACVIESGGTIRGFDWTKRKPHEMLGMPKEHYRKSRASGEGMRWGMDTWRRYHRTLEQTPGLKWETWVQWHDYYGGKLDTVLNMGEHPGKVMDYLRKQGGNREQVITLADTRRMLRSLYNRELTEEELWPRRLWEAHDRADEMLRVQQNEAKTAQYAEGFREIKEQWGHLEWTDGELCILLPMSNSELIREGEVLRHCVGGYGDRHIKGTGSIWFVRKHRRPERSYYTLNINLTTGSEIQLHGYGNERHGEKKQYSHSIPKKVRDFVNRWEKEILAPAVQEANRNKQEEKSA